MANGSILLIKFAALSFLGLTTAQLPAQAAPQTAPQTALAIALGANSTVLPITPSSSPHPSMEPAVDASITQPPTAQTVAQSLAKLPDGVYLYGEVPEREQMGKGYFVFEMQKGSVQGALYMPHSSFDCTYGKVHNNQLALTVINSYDRKAGPFTIALDQANTVASRNLPRSSEVTLRGFHRISELSALDRRVLAICKADLNGTLKPDMLKSVR
jgi:hypothetical protein